MKPFLSLFVPIIIGSTIALGVTKTWTGATNGDWSAASNWSPAAVPIATDSVIIPSVSTSPNVDSNGSCEYLSVLFGGILNFNTAGVTLTVNGNVDMLGGSDISITADAIMDIKGNIFLDGSWPFTIPPSYGTMRFSGTGDQTISGLGFGIKNLETSSVGTLVFFTNVVVDTLKLLSNNILLINDVNTSGLLTVYGDITGANPTRYLVTRGTGGLERVGVGSASATSFPIGTSTSYNPVTLKTGTGVDDFTVSVIDSVSPASLSDGSALKRTWAITEGTPGGNGSITATFDWNISDEGGNINAGNRGSLILWRYNGTAWASVGSTTLSGSGPFTATTTGLTQFSNFTLGLPGELPIQLANFTATPISQSQVRLDWITISEINNYGFEVQKSADSVTNFASIPNAFIPGHGTTNEPQQYSYVDGMSSGAWYYRLKQIDLDGSIHYSDAIHTGPATSVTEGEMPNSFTLSQSYPNPANPSTTIHYGLPHVSIVALTIFNTLGQQVAQLVHEQQQAGYHDVVFSGDELASGVYFYRLQAGDFVANKKLLLLK